MKGSRATRFKCNMGLLGRAFEHWFHLSMQLLQRMEMKVCPCRKNREEGNPRATLCKLAKRFSLKS